MRQEPVLCWITCRMQLIHPELCNLPGRFRRTLPVAFGRSALHTHYQPSYRGKSLVKKRIEQRRSRFTAGEAFVGEQCPSVQLPCKSHQPPLYPPPQHPETNRFICLFIHAITVVPSLCERRSEKDVVLQPVYLCRPPACGQFLLSSRRPLKGRELKWKALSFLAFLPPHCAPLAIIFPISSPFQKQPIMGDWRLSIRFSAKSREGGSERERGERERETAHHPWLGLSPPGRRQQLALARPFPLGRTLAHMPTHSVTHTHA